MQEKNFVSFDYKTISTTTEHQTRIVDLYESFGWELTGSTPAAFGRMVLSLKRDRKIRHKQELNRLERQAENGLQTLDRLSRAKTGSARVFAYVFGVLSALVLGGGMCLVLLNENSIPALVGGIALGLVGLALCCANYVIYQKLAEKSAKKILPLVEDEEEKLANLLERGNDLLATEEL